MTVAALSPTGAALIGAAVAALVNLAAVVVTHRLAVNRDRRNARRQRATDLVLRAAVAVSGGPEETALADELKEQTGSAAARSPRAFAVLIRCSSSLAELAFTLGREHPLSVEYGQLLTLRSKYEAEMHDAVNRFRDAGGGTPNADETTEVAEQMVEFMRRRDQWAADAQKYLDTL